MKNHEEEKEVTEPKASTSKYAEKFTIEKEMEAKDGDDILLETDESDAELEEENVSDGIIDPLALLTTNEKFTEMENYDATM